MSRPSSLAFLYMGGPPAKCARLLSKVAHVSAVIGWRYAPLEIAILYAWFAGLSYTVYRSHYKIVRPLVFGTSLPLYCLSYNHTFLPGQSSWGYEKFATRTQLFGTGPTSRYFLKHTGDKLFLRVDIKYLEMDSTATMPKKILEIDYRAMYETEANSDFILVSNDGTQKKVCRTILVSRSKFFGELFAGQSKAVQEGQYNMAVSTAVLEAMWKFMYYRGTEDMVKYAKDLLLAAVEYQVEDLKTACEAVLVASVTAANAQEMDDLAAKLDLVGLRDAVKRVNQA